jgi:hypothetical protein
VYFISSISKIRVLLLSFLFPRSFGKAGVAQHRVRIIGHETDKFHVTTGRASDLRQHPCPKSFFWFLLRHFFLVAGGAVKELLAGFKGKGLAASGATLLAHVRFWTGAGLFNPDGRRF